MNKAVTTRWLLALLSMASLYACSDDENSEAFSIVGTWSVASLSVNVNGIAIDPSTIDLSTLGLDLADSILTIGATITFNEDSTYQTDASILGLDGTYSLDDTNSTITLNLSAGIQEEALLTSASASAMSIAINRALLDPIPAIIIVSVDLDKI